MTSNAERILIVDDSSLITKMLHVKFGGMQFDVRTAGDGVQALEVIKGWMPDLMISDVMMPNMGGYELCKTLRQRPETANLPIILLTAQSGVTEKVKGFESGADDYVTKPFDFEELEARVRALLARSQAQKGESAHEKQGGELIVCFSPKGGVGTTTLAINLAVTLTQMWEAKTALIDLALPIGQVAVFMDLRSNFTLGQMAQKEIILDEDFVLQAMLPHNSGVRVLSAPRAPELSELITASLIENLFPILRDNFTFVIVDAGRNFTDAALSILERADQILLPLSPDLASLQATAVALNTFRELEYDLEKIRPILSWTFSQDALPQKEMERALGVPIQIVLPYDPRSVVQSINRGTPVVMQAGKSAISEAIENAAYQLTTENHLGKPRDNETSVLRRVRKRLVG